MRTHTHTALPARRHSQTFIPTPRRASPCTPMAAFKPQILTFYDTFYLPIVSFAMLTGFAVSLTLPVALSFSISAMESAFFYLLPQLMNAFLSWFTPPCLFVLLNGIIFVLTATSGMFSSSASCSGSSDFYTNLLGKMESFPKQSSGVLMEDLSAAVPCKNSQAKMGHQSFPAPMVDVHAHTMRIPCAVFDAHGSLQVKETKFYDAEEEEEGKGEGEEEEAPCKLAMERRSLSFSCAESRINEEDGGDEYGDAWPSSMHPKQALLNKKLSFFCKEEGDYVQTRSRSLPTSPAHYVTPPKANSVKRSLSVDSASFHGNQGSSLPSAESLSDEAFRKRVEDFISKKNAQLRNEVK